LWLWCRNNHVRNASWKYKEDESVRKALWSQLLKVPAISEALPSRSHSVPNTDDELDARVAFLLGHLWLDANETVVLLGDQDVGAFLLPKSQGVIEAFQKFLGRERAAGRMKSSGGD